MKKTETTDRKGLQQMLSEAGIRASVQRLDILEYLCSSHEHPSAEAVYAALKVRNPMLSRTTVFSCLRLFAEKGLANDIDIAAESTRYDSCQKAPHAHFMCRECRRIFDIPCEMPSFDMPEDFGCDSVNVFFKGICPECAGKKKLNNTTKQ